MPKTIDPLTPSKVSNAKPEARPKKLRDGHGLYLVVSPDGAKGWRFDYRRPGTGKRNTLSLGTFPEVSLKRAREKRDAARALLADGVDPGVQRQLQKAERIAESAAAVDAERRATEGNFEAMAQRWIELRRGTWADETRRKAELILRDYLIPVLGKADIGALVRTDVEPVIIRMAESAPALARKARQYLPQIASYAADLGLRDINRPLVLDGATLKTVMKAAKKAAGVQPAAIDPATLRKVVIAIDNYPIPVTRAALRVQLLTGQRPGNVAAMEWAELDLDAAEWSIPGPKMKMRRPHFVPLSRQAVGELREMRAYSEGRRYVFPPLARQRTPHLSRDALSAALRRAGLRGVHVPHGARATVRTMARERLGIQADVLKAQLAHAKAGEVEKAYDRTDLVDERRLLVQQWADYLDKLGREEGSTVTPILRVS